MSGFPALVAHGPRTGAGAATAPRSGSVRWHDAYFAVLLLCIAGYSTLGKGFAYAGIPPVFPAEILLAFGLLTLAWPRPGAAVIASLPMALAAVGIAWTLARTLPFVSVYGIDALRDSVVLVYALFAFVTANLVLERPERLRLFLRWGAVFFSAYALLVVPIYVLQASLGEAMPTWPLSNAPLLQMRGGEVAVHLCATTVFALLGFKRSSPLWILVVAIDIAFVASLSRGGLVSLALPLCLAIVLAGRIRPFALTVAALVPVLALAYASGLEIKLPGIQRSIDIQQLVDNVVSIAGSSGDSGLDDTKAWRLGWWEKIVDYTIRGDYFWTGKGFGINLALDDGFTTLSASGPLLRSPHNGNMTILARAGVPGLAIWAAILLSWLSTMLWYVAKASRAGDRDWSKLFVFLLAYLLSAYINASFDVALEGPMIGVVFWVVFGAGVGSAMAYDRLARA